MAARKGKGRQAVRNGGPRFPAWAGIAIGILIGAVVVLVLMRHSLLPMAPKGPQANPQATAQRGSEPGVLEPAASDSTPKKPQYDFYSVLSEKEVRIPDAEISAQAKAEQKQQAVQTPAAPTPASSPSPNVAVQSVVAAPAESVAPATGGGSGYLLQVGAFPSASVAETQKAKLAMQGFVANVQTVNISGQTYHRVRLGPFRSATELEATKQKLAAAGFPAIALKEGK